MYVKRTKTFIIIVIVFSFIFTMMLLDDRTRIENIVPASSQVGSTEQKPVRDLLTVVLTFPLLYGDSVSEIMDYQELSLKDKDQRMGEYISSLQSTLLHEYVGKVHVLFDDELLPTFIEASIFSNAFKLSFHRIENSRKESQILEYVFEHLQYQLVMIIQADTYPDAGFQFINKTRLMKHHLLYALTRHGRLEDSCNLHGEFCDQKIFVGSHDAYIFVPRGNFPTSASSYLNTKMTSWGIDLLIVWVFENVLHYRVLNPCRVIYIYHRHCSFIRNMNRHRVNTYNTTGWSPPTDKLV